MANLPYPINHPIQIFSLGPALVVLALMELFGLTAGQAIGQANRQLPGRDVEQIRQTPPDSLEFFPSPGTDDWGVSIAVDLGTSNGDRLVRYALSRHPELAEAEAEIRRQSGLRNQATRAPNPIFGYAAGEIGDNRQAGQQGIFLSQEWVTAGKLEIACQVGNWRTRAAMEGLNANRLRLSQRIQRQYWSVVAARRRIELFDLMEKLLQQAIEINETLLAAGEGTRGALLQAKLEQSQVAVAKRQAMIDLQAKTVSLAASLGIPADWIDQVENDPWPDEEIESWPNPFESIDLLATNRDLPTAGPFALQVLASPELSELQASIEAARWEVRLAQAQVVGNIESTATVQHDFSNDNVIFGIQVGAALPIRDRKTGLIQAAQATVAHREAALRSRLRDLEIRWNQARQNYQSAREMTVAIQRDLLALVEQRLDLASQAYREGEIDYLDLLTAQRSYISVQQTALDAHEQAAIAWIVLQTLAITENSLPRDDFQLLR